MVYLVPFDGSALSEAALVKATKFGTAVGERVLAFSVVRAGKAGDAVALDVEDDSVDAVVGRLHEAVESLAPNADFEHETVDRYAPSGAITSRIRRFADERDASMVFVGSENAGHIATSLTSVGRGLAADDGYDVVIVRQLDRECIERVRAASTRETLDLYRA